MAHVRAHDLEDFSADEVIWTVLLEHGNYFIYSWRALLTDIAEIVTLLDDKAHSFEHISDQFCLPWASYQFDQPKEKTKVLHKKLLGGAMPDATHKWAHCQFLELGGAFVWVAYLAQRFKELIVD